MGGLWGSVASELEQLWAKEGHRGKEWRKQGTRRAEPWAALVVESMRGEQVRVWRLNNLSAKERGEGGGTWWSGIPQTSATVVSIGLPRHRHRRTARPSSLSAGGIANSPARSRCLLSVAHSAGHFLSVCPPLLPRRLAWCTVSV